MQNHLHQHQPFLLPASAPGASSIGISCTAMPAAVMRMLDVQIGSFFSVS
jgi:uncharacterized membrane protein